MDALPLLSVPQTNVVSCPKCKVGRVIGQGGQTIKALQQYSGAIIQIDQSQDPTRVTIAGDWEAVDLAAKMIKDIVEGSFKGFAMLRQLGTRIDRQLASVDGAQQALPIYVHGYGIVPPSQAGSPTFSDSERSSKTDLSLCSPTPAPYFGSQSSMSTGSPPNSSHDSAYTSALLDSALGGSRGDINHLLQYLGHPQYQLPGAYAPARNPNLIPASRYPSSHPLLSPMEPTPTRSSVASMLGSCGLDGPRTPPQATSPADDLLWQYRAHMPALSAPSSGFHLGSRQAAAPLQNPPVMRSLFGNPMGQDRSYKHAPDWAHAEPAPMAAPISTPPTQRWWSTPASTASVSPAASTPVAPTWY